jgi:ferredoxin
MTERLEVDPIRCEGHGACAELLPELVKLDEWGYPVLGAAPVPAALRKPARRAVTLCPTLALRLVAIDPAGSPVASARSTSAPTAGKA